MGLCDGDWKSAIKFDKKEGDTTTPAYASDGTLHICPSVDTKFRGQQTVPASPLTPAIQKLLIFESGSCVAEGEDRFQIGYSRESPNGKETYNYTGSGRMLNTSQAFIYGRVKVTPKSGATGSERGGSWEAVRVGFHGNSGGAEDAIANPSEGTVTVTITSTGGVKIN